MNVSFFRDICLTASAALMLSACGGSSSTAEVQIPPPVATRSFLMGFTPWPYDATQTAVDDVNQRIQDNGDIVDHHIMVGIPWEEALQGMPYHANVDADIAGRIQMLQPGKNVFLAIDSLDADRSAMAANWGAAINEPLPPPWDSRNFADAEVATAYLNFALDMIDRFDPLYFNYGTEVSELMLKDPLAFDGYVLFAQTVYDGIKAVHPNLPVMVSIAFKSPGSTDMATISAGFDRIRDYVDIIGISTYPYVFFDHAGKGDPANLPGDWLSQVSDIAQGKPIAITENGWIAEDLVINAFGVNVASNATWQTNYVQKMLDEADQLDAEFVIWFTHVDFDALWNGALAADPVAAIWRDTGLVDENLVNRPALTEWQRWLNRPRR